MPFDEPRHQRLNGGNAEAACRGAGEKPNPGKPEESRNAGEGDDRRSEGNAASLPYAPLEG
ncbi:hypothetical protein D9M68_927510 [compost metagenome]